MRGSRCQQQQAANERAGMEHTLCDAGDLCASNCVWTMQCCDDLTLWRLQSIPVVVRRSAWQRAQGHLRLPRAITRAAARQ
jgi:hypothetical protein